MNEFHESEHAQHFHASNEGRAEAVVRNYMMWTGAAGIIPMPIVDMAAITAIQLAMLNKIGDIYDQKFSKNWAKSVIGTLVGSYTSVSLGRGIGMNLVKSIPFVGSLATMLIVPGFAAASTYALGKVFIAHFESGGTLLDFNPHKAKTYYNSLYTTQLAKGEKPTRETIKEEKEINVTKK